MRQSDLASRIGCTQAWLSQIEGERKAPSLELVEAAAEALGVPVAVLLSPTDRDEAAMDLRAHAMMLLTEMPAERLHEAVDALRVLASRGK